jgi:flagellar motor switch protein FliN
MATEPTKSHDNPPSPDTAASAAAPPLPDLSKLPSYVRSLLRVKVPLKVVLAENKQSIDSIVRLGPGSIIQFEKSCEEMLDVQIANQHIAQGEVVKVGDKFGVRVTSIVLPEERFRTLRAG